MTKFTRAATLIAATALSACGGAGVQPDAPASAPTEEASTMEQAPDLSSMNESARAGAVVETLHGVDVADPFMGSRTTATRPGRGSTRRTA